MRNAALFPIVAGAALLAACGGDTSGPSAGRPNGAPTPWFTVSCSGLACDFTNRSFDGEAGPLASHAWDFGDGTTSTAQSPNHRYAANGAYQVVLTVTDRDGNTAKAARQVGVRSQLVFAVACASLVCTFTNQSVTDPGIAFLWEFGDGEASGEANPTHAYSVTGPATFTVTLTAWDGDLDIASASRDITVAPAAP